MAKAHNLTNKKFGHLTVIKRVANSIDGKPQWLCQCSCGKEKIMRASSLKSGATNCGCRHGLTPKKYILSKIKKTKNGCWEWLGCKTIGGSGMTTILGKPEIPYRASYKIFIGVIPKGKFICHKCDNRKCVNPDHLFAATQKENMRDMVLKGRSNYGSMRPNAKLNDEKIKEIRQMRKEGFLQREIAKKMGVNRTIIEGILLGYRWKHVK